MQNRTTKELFDLIKGMNKWEKKCFSHYTRRNSSSESPGVLRLFRILNSMEQWDERLFANKVKGMQYRQLPGLKVKLYHQILDSLRTGKKEENVVMQLHHLMDHVQILHAKGFWVQALKVLKRLKHLATSYHQLTFLFQALTLQRKIEGVYGQYASEAIERLNDEIRECYLQLSLAGHLSNQSMLLYGWYQRSGGVHNEKEGREADALYAACFPVDEERLTFYPRLYLIQAKTYYYRLKRQTDRFYEAACEWVQHFENNPSMKGIEPLQYQRGQMYLNEAALLNGREEVLYETARKLCFGGDAFYKCSSALNECLLKKQTDNCLLEEAYRYVQSAPQPSRLYQICHKAAQLCSMEKNWERVIDFTLVALNRKAEARIDLQYQLRRLHLQAHTEMENFTLTEYLETSLRRFARAHQVPDEI